MKLNRDIIAKRIEQILVTAAIMAYWAPAIGYVGSKVEAYFPVLEAAVQQPKNTTIAHPSLTTNSENTTIAYEVFTRPVSANTLD